VCSTATGSKKRKEKIWHWSVCRREPREATAINRGREGQGQGRCRDLQNTKAKGTGGQKRGTGGRRNQFLNLPLQRPDLQDNKKGGGRRPQAKERNHKRHSKMQRVGAVTNKTEGSKVPVLGGLGSQEKGRRPGTLFPN